MLASMMQPDLSDIIVSGPVRTAALNAWKKNGWPGPRVESWRFTKLDRLSARDMSPVSSLCSMKAGDGIAIAHSIEAHVIRVVNGVIDQASLRELPAGIVSGNLREDHDAQDVMMALVPKDHPVSNLSMAVMSGGLILDVAGDIKRPVMFIFEGKDANLSAHPVILIRLAPSAQMVMTEWHQSAVGLSAPLIGIDMAAESRLHFVKIQLENNVTAHLAATGVVLAENAELAGFSLSVGGEMARLETHVTLSGEGADCKLSAVYLGRERQHHDITTVLNHDIGHCNSDQVIRGVLDDKARGVYQGKVRVAEGAQKTDGQQMSRALLLSRRAEVDAKPELEIYADDVVCAHGATVGELDATQLFYLKSRGIPDAAARSMLIEAFLIDAIDKVENDSLSQILRSVTAQWMAQTGLKKDGN